ncbi:MAG TPA: hypothetical protein DDZ51_07960 [Planctomycetaceae bacterium]|nr:hypothetical protein [Planctomycetaceae bacterium]
MVLIPKSASVFYFFKILKSVVTRDIQYLLAGEAPGAGNILRVRRFRFGRPSAISPTGNVPLASSTPASSSSATVSLFDAPIATTRYPMGAPCRRVLQAIWRWAVTSQSQPKTESSNPRMRSRNTLVRKLKQQTRCEPLLKHLQTGGNRGANAWPHDDHQLRPGPG